GGACGAATTGRPVDGAGGGARPGGLLGLLGRRFGFVRGGRRFPLEDPVVRLVVRLDLGSFCHGAVTPGKEGGGLAAVQRAGKEVVTAPRRQQGRLDEARVGSVPPADLQAQEQGGDAGDQGGRVTGAAGPLRPSPWPGPQDLLPRCQEGSSAGPAP